MLANSETLKPLTACNGLQESNARNPKKQNHDGGGGTVEEFFRPEAPQPQKPHALKPFHPQTLKAPSTLPALLKPPETQESPQTCEAPKTPRSFLWGLFWDSFQPAQATKKIRKRPRIGRQKAFPVPGLLHRILGLRNSGLRVARVEEVTLNNKP